MKLAVVMKVEQTPHSLHGIHSISKWSPVILSNKKGGREEGKDKENEHTTYAAS